MSVLSLTLTVYDSTTKCITKTNAIGALKAAAAVCGTAHQLLLLWLLRTCVHSNQQRSNALEYRKVLLAARSPQG
eukprot:15283-Heterococcus_DN1.PRE.2